MATQQLVRASVTLLLVLSLTNACRPARRHRKAGEIARDLLDAFSGDPLLEASLQTVTSSGSRDMLADDTNTFPLLTRLQQLKNPIGSGENLAELQGRIQTLKGYYKDARTVLGIDDAVRIEGYINTLEGIGIDFLGAYPLNEVAMVAAYITLGSAITALVGGVLYTAASAVGLASTIIYLQLAIDSLPPKSDPAAVREMRQNQMMMDQMIRASESINSQLLPWVLGGGVMGPVNMATDLLKSVGGSMTQLSVYVPPASLLDAPLAGVVTQTEAALTAAKKLS